MKISTTQNQMIIDNSSTGPVVMGIAFVVIGLGALGVGLFSHTSVLMMVGGVFAVVGALLAVFARSSKIVLDKAGPSTASSKSMFSQTKVESFNVNEVNAVLLEARETSETINDQDGTSRNQTKIVVSVFLTTRTAQRIQLGSATKIGTLGGLVGAIVTSLPLREEAMKISTFLGVPLQASDSIGNIQSLL